MARVAGRTPADTKRLILEAAARVVRRDGLAATLEDIAIEAGVSKGGLVYHFRSKQALLLALGEAVGHTFDALVEANLDPSDTRPGRLTRAYIRASFADADDETATRDNIALAAHLMSNGDLRRLADEDGSRWRTALHDDGLPAPTVSLIVAACDGASTGALWGRVLTDDDVAHLEQHLLELTFNHGPAIRTD